MIVFVVVVVFFFSFLSFFFFYKSLFKIRWRQAVIVEASKTWTKGGRGGKGAGDGG